MKSRITKQKRKSEVTGWVQPRISGSNCRTSQKAAGKAKETAGVKQRLLSVEGRKEMGAHRGARGRISGKPFMQATALQTARLCGGLPGSAPGRSEAWRPANLVPGTRQRCLSRRLPQIRGTSKIRRSHVYTGPFCSPRPGLGHW